MSVDPLSPVAPARVRILLLPAGKIKKHRFLHFASKLRQEQIVRLCDITPDTSSSGNNLFSPLAFPDGAIFYYMTLSPSPSALDLAPIELFRQPLVVLCVADGQEYLHDPSRDLVDVNNDAAQRARDHADLLEQEVDLAKSRHPSALVTQLVMCDCPNTNRQVWIPDSALLVPLLEGSTTALKTVMCDISAKLLAAMSVYASTVRSRNTVVIPAIVQLSSVQDTRQVINERSTSGRESTIPVSPGITSRRSSSSKRPDYAVRSTSPSVAGDSRPNSPPTRQDQAARPEMTGIKPKSGGGVWKRNSKATPPAETKPRGRRASRSLFPGGGSSSEASTVERERNIGRTRIGIVIGTMNLMLGRWPEAWKELLEHTAQARALSDWLWHAKGLENILVCMILFSWAGHEYAIPSMAIATADKRVTVTVTEMAKDLLTHLGPRHEQNKTTTSSKLGQALHDILNTVLMYYGRAATSTTDRLPPVANSEMLIRLSKLAAHVASTGGELDEALLEHLVMGSTTTGIPRTKLSAATHIVKPAYAVIANEVFGAYPDPYVSMELTARVTILAGISSVLSLLSLERKQAIVLKTLLTSLVPALYEARKLGAAEVGMHPAASVSLTSAAAASGDGVAASEIAVQEMLLHLQEIYGIPGFTRGPEHAPDEGLEVAVSNENEMVNLVSTIATNAAVTTKTTKSCGLTLKLDYLRACIELCEALPDLAGIVHWSAILLRTAGPVRPILVQDGGPHVKLATEEQIRHVLNISRASSAASKSSYATVVEGDYWDDYLVRKVELVDAADRTTLVARSDESRQITRRALERDASAHGRAEHTQSTNVMVQGEPIDLAITLQNPYDVDVVIESVSFLTSLGQLEPHSPQQFTLGPSRLQRIHCQVIAKSVGPVNVHGCVIKVANCARRIFPIYPGTDLRGPSKAGPNNQKSLDARRMPVNTALTLQIMSPQPKLILKHFGLSCTSSLVPTTQPMSLMLLEGERKTLSMTVHNVSSIDVGSLHISSEDDHTALLTRRLAKLKSDLGTAGHSSASRKAKIFDLETILHETTRATGDNALFAWRRSDEGEESGGPVIKAGQCATYTITILGRQGLSEARFLVEYAAGQSDAVSPDVSSSFYRQLQLPLKITVVPALEVRDMSIRPYPKRGSGLDHRNSHSNATTASEDRAPSSADSWHSAISPAGLTSYTEEEEVCLLQCDIVNLWDRPLEASVSTAASPSESDLIDAGDAETDTTNSASKGPTKHVKRLIHPGPRGERIFILLPRIYLAEPYARIPAVATSPSAHEQFTVEKLDPSQIDIERRAREHFWLREALVKTLQVCWSDPSAGVKGLLSPRSIFDNTPALRLSNGNDTREVQAIQASQDLQGLRALRLDDVRIETLILSSGDDGSLKSQDRGSTGAFTVSVEQSLVLRTRVYNRSPSRALRAVLRLVPQIVTAAASASSQSTNDLVKRCLLFSGQLQRPLPPVGPGKIVDVDLHFCLVVPACIQIDALVEEVDLPQTQTQTHASASAPDFGFGSSSGVGTSNAHGHHDEQRGLDNSENDPDWDLNMARYRDERLMRERRRVWVAEEKCIIRSS